MRITSRRTTLVSLGAAAGATVAAAILVRKPREVAHPVAAPAEAAPGGAHLAPLSAVIARDPPAAPEDVAFLDADGKPHHLSEFAGKNVVLNLWATWCVPCVAELPALAEFARRAGTEGIVVIPLSSDMGGADVVRKFYKARGLTDLPVWLDPKGDAARAWGVRGIPTTLLIDRQGRERARVEGSVDWAAESSFSRVRALLG
jgi:thiol-disulfide isomerase/thioredoxin